MTTAAWGATCVVWAGLGWVVVAVATVAVEVAEWAVAAAMAAAVTAGATLGWGGARAVRMGADRSTASPLRRRK